MISFLAGALTMFFIVAALVCICSVRLGARQDYLECRGLDQVKEP